MRNARFYKIKNKVILIIEIIILLQSLRFFYADTMVYADSIRYDYNSSSMTYPGYRDRIDILKAAHPNWNFVIMKTGLDWNEVIANEYTGHFDTPSNLIQGKSGGWVCSICGSRVYDTGEWLCASESAIRYYVDPRNWLVDSPYLFQFLQTDYMETLDQDIYEALNGTFLYSWDIASTINKACKNNNASPYFIIARILQEQGPAGGRTYMMRDSDGKIYYNLFNIGATGNTEDEVYANALARAKQDNWTSIESCLNGGITFLISSYISYKQNTLYLNKFDVESYMGLYYHQYMQNIEAPKNEAISMYNKMKNANLLNRNLTFVIPVFENMPANASPSPDTAGEAFPKNIRVKEGHYGIMVRAGRSTTSSILDRIADSSVVILSVERYSDGWHKIVLENGTVGYVKFNTDYLEEISDVTNCYETMKIKANGTILRAGPGLEHVEITTLNAGDEVVRIDNTARYTFGGQIWDRINIKDGRQGFVIRDVLSDSSENEAGTEKSKNVIEEDQQGQIKNETEGSNNKTGDQQGQSNNELDESRNETDKSNNETNQQQSQAKNETDQSNNENNQQQNQLDNETDQSNNENNQQQNQLDNESDQSNNEINQQQGQAQNETDQSNNETEEQRGQSKNELDESRNEINEEHNNSKNESGENVVVDDTKKDEREYLIIGPEKQSSDLEGVVTKNGVQTEEAGTGYIITINDKEYIIVKRGDANGDGYVKANDYLIIKDYIIGANSQLKNEYLQAADVTNDKSVKANDYLKIKDHIMYGVEI